MNEQEKNNNEQTDELGNELESGDKVNAVIEQQGDDAAAGILRGADAAKHEQQTNESADKKCD